MPNCLNNYAFIFSSSACHPTRWPICIPVYTFTITACVITTAERIIINFSKIMDWTKACILKRVKDFTQVEYTNYLLACGGKEHFAFLNYLSSTYGDCRHLVDIGTRFMTSALL